MRRGNATCSIEGCVDIVAGTGLCPKHWMRRKRHGDPLQRGRIRGDDEARFWSKVDRRAPDECWPWTGALSRDGYGRMRTRTSHVGAHRFAYELLVGPIPEGLTIDHLCATRACVNTSHMECVTRGENTRRAMARLKAAS